MKLIFIIIGAVMLLAFLLPVFSRVFNIANAVGIIFGALFVAAGIKYDEMGFELKKWTLFVLVIGLAVILIMAIHILREGRTTASNETVLILLGCKVKGDKPSLALLKRVDSAYKYMLCHPKSVAVLSGGQGRDEMISEAECMRRILCERGISENRLFLEKQSRSTDENIRFSAEIIRENSLPERVAIVSSEYHLCRAGRICRRYGLECAFISSRTRPDLLPTFLLREVMAMVKNLFN